MIRKIAAVAAVGALAAFGLLSHPGVTNPPRGGHFVTTAFDSRPPACTRPAVVRDGLIEVTCFPVIPAKQFPVAGVKCSHIDSWVTGHSTETVNGQRYKITQKVRDDVWICKG